MFGLAFAMGGAPGGAAGPAGGMAAFQQVIPLVFMFAIFYFLLIRPQQKKAKEHKALLEAIKKGDRVKTAGGVIGLGSGGVGGVGGGVILRSGGPPPPPVADRAVTTPAPPPAIALQSCCWAVRTARRGPPADRGSATPVGTHTLEALHVSHTPPHSSLPRHRRTRLHRPPPPGAARRPGRRGARHHPLRHAAP